MKYQKSALLIALIFVLNACATYKPQYKDKNSQSEFPDKEIIHSFYLIGDAGISGESESSKGIFG